MGPGLVSLIRTFARIPKLSDLDISSLYRFFEIFHISRQHQRSPHLTPRTDVRHPCDWFSKLALSPFRPRSAAAAAAPLISNESFVRSAAFRSPSARGATDADADGGTDANLRVGATGSGGPIHKSTRISRRGRRAAFPSHNHVWYSSTGCGQRSHWRCLEFEQRRHSFSEGGIWEVNIISRIAYIFVLATIY